MPNRPPRISLIFQKYDQPLYFVTFNTAKRAAILANEGVHHAFIEFCKKAETSGIAVGRYVIMPDHVHLFVRGPWDFELSQWVRLLKRCLSIPISSEPPHWQKGFFDHLMRNDESYSEKWNYVWQNPVRAGLVVESALWPYQGEIVHLPYA